MSTRLARDARGAIALLALFMAVCMTALVYYVAGIGESVLQREQMQNAADAAAFSAAVLHARGMNAIVLVNMVMAALLAVLVSLKLVELLTAIAILAIALASFFAPGLAAAVPGLAEARAQVREAHDAVRPGIYAALDALHVAARGIRVLVPVASQHDVLETIRERYAPPVQLAFAAPARTTLPTRDGSFAELCDRAGEFSGGLTKWALDEVIPADVAGLVGDAIADLAKSRADWFCGAGGEPPRPKVTHEVRYPLLAARERCQALASNTANVHVAPEDAAACEQAERDEQDALPAEDTGACRVRCAQDDPYELAAAAARAACAPRPGRDALRAFSWQERRYVREYSWTRTGWSRISSDADEERGARYRLREADRRPCGEPFSPISREWHAEPVDRESGEALPLCSNAAAPALHGRSGAVLQLEHVDVVRIFGCTESVTRRYDLAATQGSDRLDAQTAEDKVPQELSAEVTQGEEPLQIRAAVIGELPPAGAEGVLRVATWLPGDDLALALPGSDARELGRVAVARAEYFYAGERETPPAEMMWNMRWQARLRRFRSPEVPRASAQRAPTSDAADPFAERLAGAPSFASLAEACAALEPTLPRSKSAEPRQSPCAALDRVLDQESLH